MERYVINGGAALRGDVPVSGAKNAAVAILPATLIANGVCVLDNVPNIQDINVAVEILKSLGARVEHLGHNTLRIDTSSVNSTDVTHEAAGNMRGSYYFLGALLTRFGRAAVAMPGGCNLGPRPIDLHIKMFSALKCEVNVEYRNVTVCGDSLEAAHIFFDKVSVGATINAMLASVRAQGVTVLENVAKEPHIVDVANFLNSMGADVRGAGTDVIKIRGVESFHGTEYSIIPDQIEAGTYMAAAVATAGDITVRNVIPRHLEVISSKLREVGAEIEEFDDAVRVRRSEKMRASNLRTLPYPGYPTDMQPQFGVLMSVAAGTSLITENVWESRFRYLDELRDMGANVQTDGNVAVIEGVEKLQPATLHACDLRAGAALVIAALMTEGTSYVEDIYHIERGYENIIGKLTALGADIRRED